MKKDKTTYHYLKRPKVYREQLIAIEQALTQESLNAFRPELKIVIKQTKDYFDRDEAKSVSEIPTNIIINSIDFTAHYSISGESYPYISVTLGKSSYESKIVLTGTNPTLRGIVEEIKGIISDCERPLTASLVKHPIVTCWLPLILIWFSGIGITARQKSLHPRQPAPSWQIILLGSVILIFVLSLFYLFRADTSNYSKIVAAPKSARPGFWKLHSDDLIIATVGAIAGAIVTVALTFLLLK